MKFRALDLSIIPSGRYFWRKSTQNVGEPFRNGSPHTPSRRNKGHCVPLVNPLLTPPLYGGRALSGKTNLQKPHYLKLSRFDHPKLCRFTAKNKTFHRKGFVFCGESEG